MKKFFMILGIAIFLVVLIAGGTLGITYAVDKDLATSWLDKIGIHIEDDSSGIQIGPDEPTPDQPGTDIEEPENPDDTKEPDEEAYICNVSDYEFDGNTITAYNGDDKYIQIPSSYSISGTETVKMNFNKMEFQEYLMMNFEDITYPITITDSNSELYTLNSEMDVFENQDIVYPVSLEIEKTIYDEGDDYQVAIIGERSFEGNSSIEGVKLSNGLENIEDYAFASCKNLKSITISESVENFGFWIFKRCDALEEIKVEEGNSKYHSAGNCVVETETKNLVVGCKNSVIPTDGSVVLISNYSFLGCNLESITIPERVTVIGIQAFSQCENLTMLIMSSQTPPQLQRNVFSDCNNLQIYVPESAVATYKAAYGWSEYANIIQAIPEASVGDNEPGDIVEIQ